VRGVGPRSFACVTRSVASSPRARGWSQRDFAGLRSLAGVRLARGWSAARAQRLRPDDVIPACAGLVRGSGRSGRFSTCRPRVRGLVPGRTRSPLRIGRRPRVRGWSGPEHVQGGAAAVVPAFTGWSVRAPGRRRRLSSCPRVRGIGPSYVVHMKGVSRSSPRAITVCCPRAGEASCPSDTRHPTRSSRARGAGPFPEKWSRSVR
jgi:hypothetical protein